MTLSRVSTEMKRINHFDVGYQRKRGLVYHNFFQALTERLSGEVAQHTLRLPPQEGRLRSRFYQLQAIEKEWMEEDGSVGLQVRMPIVDWRRLCKQEPALEDYVV